MLWRHLSPSLSDQHECYPLRCDVNAQCLLNAGSPTCLCLEGFSGDGQLCVREYFCSTEVEAKFSVICIVCLSKIRIISLILLRLGENVATADQQPCRFHHQAPQQLSRGLPLHPWVLLSVSGHLLLLSWNWVLCLQVNNPWSSTLTVYCYLVFRGVHKLCLMF